MKLMAKVSWVGVIAALCLAACTKPQPVQPVTQAVTNPSPAVFDHKLFGDLLAAYVNEQGWVDYPGLQKERGKLEQYLTALATANPDSFPNDAERLAFWINAYNAFTLADVVDKVYGKAKSVQDVKGFFNRKKHRIAGVELTLDEIEKQGRDLQDPRIHFAVNCASTSCPKLQRFVFTGAELESQLQKTAREFLSDITRGMNYDPNRNQVALSSIFKWYAADFTQSNAVVARLKAETSGAELLEMALKYVPVEVAQFMREKKPTVKYLDYDWSLNAQETHP
jgi:hypothetical protein